MTNVSAGSKRSRDGSESSGSKRPREGEAVEDHGARDWRDVHLDSPRRKHAPSSRKEDSRRGYNDRDYRDYGRRGSDRKFSSDHDRDRYSRRDDRRDDRDRRDRRDGSRRQRTRSRSRGSARSHRSSGQDHPRKDDEEREEGEISPRQSRANSPPSPNPKGHRPTPHHDTGRPDNEASEPQFTSQSQLEPDMELDLAPSPPPVETTLAERRAKRLAILAKYNGIASAGASPSPAPSSAVLPPPSVSPVSDPVSRTHSISATPAATELLPSSASANGNPNPRESMSASPTPEDFSLAKNDQEEDAQTKVLAENQGAEQISAADYDPSLDRREDEQRRVHGVETIGEDEEEEEEIEEEDLDDMFAVAASDKKVKKVKKKKPAAPALITTTLDSAADAEGYYSVILGEQLDGGRYQVFSSLGQGMFANVVRARVLQGELGEVGKEVAIKIVRCQESMYKSGLKEAQILNKLKQADPEDKKHIVRLERTFEHRGHLCMVFESMSMNLRDVVKRFGKDVGLNIRAVRAYAHQLFLALSLLRKANIMHADIKPDNILVNEQKTLLKLCDLGSASDASENDITPYLVSRFYRAPEIIMGVPYDPALDIWSIGCTLYELYTGKILFPGRSNNHMLLLMMELKGRFNSKMIKKAKFGNVFFDETGGFESVERDKLTGTDVVRKVHISKPSRDLRARLMPPSSVKLRDDENKMLTSFIDLLDKCLALDPSRRITPREALAHPFIRG
ncbi:hypothetical protein HGRIS_013879 [Hohenbuehelia grisea]|uniref:non-specific serine/threonine protein kinase n=1 Tax=Hohenbuehelia grisea TaxID=104357 RepID=A0ABR3IWU5_9AGAR